MLKGVQWRVKVSLIDNSLTGPITGENVW